MKGIFSDGNFWAFLVSASIAISWVEICKLLATKGLLVAWQRRKLLHVVTGPLYITTWTMFSNDHSGALWAALVPLAMTMKFIAVGIGILKDDDMVSSASRNNARGDLLKGPTLYGFIFVITTVLFWKSVQSVLCLFILCFGDGFAEICGRNFGRGNKIIYSPDKSIAGFLGFVSSSLVTTLLFLYLYGDQLFGLHWQLRPENRSVFIRIFVDCIIGGIVETLPLSDIDNVTVFLSAVLSDKILLLIL